MALKYKYTLLLFILTLISKYLCEKSKRVTHFVMKSFGENNEELTTYNLIFNYERKRFEHYSDLYQIVGIKYIILCSIEDIDKDENERKLLTFWNTSDSNSVFTPAFYISAFPLWYYQQKEKGDTFCFRSDSVGWYQNANATICDDSNPTIPCPDIIMLDTAQLTQRYDKKQTISLNKYFRKYFLKTGKPLESLINKNLYYDYNVDNNWLAVPIAADFRIFLFNITTFDYCKSKNFDLHYPPPLSDYWGEDYQKTWTWDKVFEYAEKINKCLGKPSFKIMAKYYEDLKFFITLCQSLKIPFFVDDSEHSVKKCGLRGEKNIKKLQKFKDFVENQYIEMWLNKKKVDEWINTENIEEQPILTYDDNLVVSEMGFENIFIYGMQYTSLFMFYKYLNTPEIKYSYVPGGSYLGGSGAAITKGSKFPDQAFEFLEFLIDDKYPYFSDLNIAITPFDNVYGVRCLRENFQKTKIELCYSLIENEGTFPYYYIKNNVTYIVYLTHSKNGSNKVITINESWPADSIIVKNSLKSMKFTCGNKADFKNRIIEYYDDYRIILPVSDNETIILKSMRDIDNTKHVEQTQEIICSIYDETIKIAKPMEFPYNNFNELNKLQERAPISLLFAHLYYKPNNTEMTFEEIVDECCNIIDDALFPDCESKDNIIYKLADSCNDREETRDIIYINCKNGNNSSIPKSIPCTYIPFKSTTGWMLLSITFVSIFVEVFFGIIIIIKRKTRCINISGIKFLLFFVSMNILLKFSIICFIGKYNKINCILRIWLMAIGLTFIICAYSIKSEFIISVYYNNKLTNSNVNNSIRYLKYIILSVCQIVLLTIWTITHEGIINDNKYLDKIGNINFKTCSTGNKYILFSIFTIEYILLMISIIISFQGRNIPNEFNESKQMFIISILSCFQLILCYLTTIINVFDYQWKYYVTLILIVIISLITNIIFIGLKILIIYNIIDYSKSSDVVVVKKNNITNESDSSNKYSINDTNII